VDLEELDRPAIERALSAARGASIIAIEAATTAAGVAIAEAVLAESPSGGLPSIFVAIPRVDESCVAEEVAAAIVQELGVPSAPREDEAGLVDAAAEALRLAAPPYVIFTEAETWLRSGGAAKLASWADETTTRFIVVVTAPDATLFPPGTVRVAVAPRSEAGMAEMLEHRFSVLGELEREIVRCLARCPVAIPASVLASAIDTAEIGGALDALARDGVLAIAWTAGELFVRLSADAFAIHQRGADAVDEARHFDEGLFLAVLESAPEALDVGELVSFRDADLLARQRATLRALLARAHGYESDHVGRLTLVTMTALEPLGPLLEVCALAERAQGAAKEDGLRARLEERRARVLRALGRLDEAARCLERAAPHAAALSPRAAARLAFALARMALPELDGAHLAARAEEIVSGLVGGLATDDALVVGLIAHTRAAMAWHSISAEAAIAPMLEAVIAYGTARREQLQVAALASLAVHHLGAERSREAAELARQLEREGARLGRSEIVATANAHRGCAALQAGDVPEAIRALSAAIDRMSALGYRQGERWARAHRGLAMLAGGRTSDAMRDFDDFVAMTRIVGGSDLVGVIGGALAGSPSAKERLLALHDRSVPPYLRAVVRAVRVILTDAPASRAIAGEVHAPPPGYFAFEVRELERAALRATSTAPETPAAAGAREMLVARDGSWFELEGEPRVSLGRTRTLRQVLHGFVVAHARGRPLDLEEVFVLGWPDERASAASRANRVHVTLSRLRATGLGEALAFGEGGWRLDQALRVVTI
jgi:tetratricopeptide (TPR) repeat protein